MSPTDTARLADCFALLGEARRPALDVPALKQKFLRLSSEVHPDRVHEQAPEVRRDADERYAALNAAWTCLSNTKERLGHLLTLERSQRPTEIHAIAPEAADSFLQVAGLCRRVDEFLARKAAATSPLLQARMVAETVGLRDMIQEMTGRFRRQETELESALALLNPMWEKAPDISDPGRAAALPLADIEAAWRSLSYSNKWTRQLQERLLQLTI